jgi:exodeoxyribonuclease V alpha subunit
LSEILEGYVDKIVFRNAENGYTVFSLINDDLEMTCVGILTFISEGEFIRATGSYTAHQLYGEQFQIQSYEFKEPEDLQSIEKYLGSGAIKGIGNALAARIVRRFKNDTFRIIEQEPERLSEVKGISDKMAREIAKQFDEKKDMRDAMLFLQQYGISTAIAVKIYKEYGSKMYEIVKENPYKMAEDINGIGFKLADEIATRVGIGKDSDYRMKAAILYILLQGSASGHTFLPKDVLAARIAELLNTDVSGMEHCIMDLAMDKKIIIREASEEMQIYGASLFYLELNTAKMLCDLNIKYDLTTTEIDLRLSAVEKQFQIVLDEMQRTAVIEAARNGLLVLTGGPGTGKTTTINAIIRFFEAEGMDILLAAPTGRAAKRMTETTGYEARTMHRLLEISKMSGETDLDHKMIFERNEENPLEADVIIIDEMSMVDISLMHALLRAITVGTRLILVGDVNQLPSVGPGNVLKDIINSHNFNVVKLTKIFRQAIESDIIVNAHKINAGEKIKLDNKSKDFFILRRDNVKAIIETVKANIFKMAKYYNTTPFEIQILTPMRKGDLGVENLNKELQQYMNPEAPEKKEKEYQQGIFREGDKVMQIKNNYQLTWEVKSQYGITTENGSGVFNGDMGIIKEINLFAEQATVEFDEGRLVEYTFSQLEELELAYAITIHKSQGSEYPAVIMPLLTGPRMLFNRNLLYTAVTRAKNCVLIVGSDDTVQLMIDNESEQRRYSSLSNRVMELTKFDSAKNGK